MPEGAVCRKARCPPAAPPRTRSPVVAGQDAAPRPGVPAGAARCKAGSPVRNRRDGRAARRLCLRQFRSAAGALIGGNRGFFDPAARAGDGRLAREAPSPSSLVPGCTFGTAPGRAEAFATIPSPSKEWSISQRAILVWSRSSMWQPILSCPMACRRRLPGGSSP